MKPLTLFSVAAFVAGTSLTGTYASGVEEAGSPPPTSLENALEHPTIGCGGAVVQTPRPGTQFADPLLTAPKSAISFYAKAASLNATWLSTLDCTATGRTHVLIPAAPNAPTSGDENTAYISLNWSGYQINNTAQFVQSGWTIPTVVNPPLLNRYSTTGYASSTWAGIGGGVGGADPLIQSGSAQDLSASNVATYYFWYEIVPGLGEIKINNHPVAPGDDVGAASIWLQSTMQAEMGICNFTRGTPTCVQFYVSNTPQPGATVEWIVEAPTSYGVIQPLADFGLVNFYNACWAATYTPGPTVPCSPINVPGVTSPSSLSLRQKVFGCYQFLAIPQALTSNSSFTDTYRLPARSSCP